MSSWVRRQSPTAMFSPASRPHSRIGSASAPWPRAQAASTDAKRKIERTSHPILTASNVPFADRVPRSADRAGAVSGGPRAHVGQSMSGASKKLITYPAVYRIGEHQAITQQGKSHMRLSQSGRALIPRARRLSPDGVRSSRTEHGVRLSERSTASRRAGLFRPIPTRRSSASVRSSATISPDSGYDASTSLPGEAVPTAVQPQARRPATAARHRRAGGQDRPARGGGGAERHLRDGLPRLLLWLPAGAQAAPCAGCARGRDLPAEDQLDPGCRYPGVLGDGIIMPPGSCGWAKEVGLLVYLSDTQAFSLAGANVHGSERAALDTLQHGLA